MRDGVIPEDGQQAVGRRLPPNLVVGGTGGGDGSKEEREVVESEETVHGGGVATEVGEGGGEESLEHHSLALPRAGVRVAVHVLTASCSALCLGRPPTNS